MKDRKTSPDHPQEKQLHHIPDLQIIDLEENTLESEDDSMLPQDLKKGGRKPEKASGKSSSGSFLSRINIHFVLLAVFILFIAGIAYKITHFGIKVDLDEVRNAENDEEHLSLLHAYDNNLPLLNAKGEPIYKYYGEGTTILAFGNAPFADDRYSEDSLANIIQKSTGATVYNCAVSGSYLAAESPMLDSKNYPMDLFSFYWLCTVAVGDAIDNAYLFAVETLGADAPAEAMEVFNTLKTIDYDTIDVITIMYDGSDYLAGHEMYNDDNDQDILQFTGNMVAGIRLLQSVYPHIRIIVMSPAYAFGIDENGDYISSDIQTYGQDVLSTYVLMQAQYCYNMSITYVDHLYGTITQDNAADNLIDNLHLNVAGRKKVSERFVRALQFFNDSAAKDSSQVGDN